MLGPGVAADHAGVICCGDGTVVRWLAEGRGTSVPILCEVAVLVDDVYGCKACIMELCAR